MDCSHLQPWQTAGVCPFVHVHGLEKVRFCMHLHVSLHHSFVAFYNMISILQRVEQE